MKPYKTILNESEAELSIQKSRFIGYALPVENEQEAVQFIEKIKKKHYNATHNVPVYLIGEDMMVQRYSDDGEPSGTAGIPILEMLKKEGITNICIVVTRYFGGIKLGTGGLVRAYTDSAKAVLESAQVVRKAVFRKLDVTIPYHLHGKVQNAILGREDVYICNTDYSDYVKIEMYVLEGLQEAVVELLVDLTSNQALCQVDEMEYLTEADGKLLEI